MSLNQLKSTIFLNNVFQPRTWCSQGSAALVPTVACAMEEVLKAGNPHRNHQNNERFHILYQLLDDDDDDIYIL